MGSILAYLATGLKDRITENQRFEKQQNILYAMGVHNNEDDSSVNSYRLLKLVSALMNLLKVNTSFKKVRPLLQKMPI